MTPELIWGAAEVLEHRDFAECLLKMRSLFSAERQKVSALSFSQCFPFSGKFFQLVCHSWSLKCHPHCSLRRLKPQTAWDEGCRLSPLGRAAAASARGVGARWGMTKSVGAGVPVLLLQEGNQHQQAKAVFSVSLVLAVWNARTMLCYKAEHLQLDGFPRVKGSFLVNPLKLSAIAFSPLWRNRALAFLPGNI